MEYLAFFEVGRIRIVCGIIYVAGAHQLKSGAVGGRVADVFGVLCGYIGLTEEVDELLGFCGVLAGLWNYDVVEPEVGAAIGAGVSQIGVAVLGVHAPHGVSAVNYRQRSAAAYHAILDLIAKVCLNQRLLFDECLLGSRDVSLISGVYGVTQLHQRDAYGIAYAVVHQYLAGVFLVPEYIPAVNGIVNHGGVVEYAYGSPHVRNAVLVVGIKFEIHEAGIDVL